MRRVTFESSLHFLFTLEQHRVNDILSVWTCFEVSSANDNNPCSEASHHGKNRSDSCDVLCERAFSFLKKKIGANHVHSTSSRPRPACDTFRSKNARGWSPSTAEVELSLVGRHPLSSTVRQQQLSNQTASTLHKQGIGTNARGRTATQGISPSDESENSTSHSAASKAPRAFASTYEKAATPRQPPL